MKLNDIFTLDEYAEAYDYVVAEGYAINEIEQLGGERRFQIVEIPQPTQDELDRREINELKDYLSNTDYVVIKIAEGVATAEDYAEVLVKRAEARARINELG